LKTGLQTYTTTPASASNDGGVQRLRSCSGFSN
jgi:hypothetical protein